MSAAEQRAAALLAEEVAEKVAAQACRAAADLQALIDAEQDRELVLYALRSVAGSESRSSLLFVDGGPRIAPREVADRQLARGRPVAERLLGCKLGGEALTFPHGAEHLRAALKLADLEIATAKARVAAHGSRAQLRLSLNEGVPLARGRRNLKPQRTHATVAGDLTKARNVSGRERGGTTMPKTTKSAAKSGKTEKPAAKAEKRVSGPELMAAVLNDAARPLHNSIIAERVIALDLKRPLSKRSYKGKTPAQTISAALTMSHLSGGRFVKTEPGCFAIRDWTKAKLSKAAERPERKRASSKTPDLVDGVDPQVAKHTKVIAEAKPGGRKAKPAAKISEPVAA